jgi:hypothetical protein
VLDFLQGQEEAKPRGEVHWCFRSSARVDHSADMPPGYDFKLALARVIRWSGLLATLEDAARFVGLLRTWRQARHIL